MRVLCSIDETELENDEGRAVDGVEANCGRCRHTTQSFGTGPGRIKLYGEYAYLNFPDEKETPANS